MSRNNEKHTLTELQLFEPSFGSPLTTLVLELEHLRRLRIQHTTHPALFNELKQLFHSLESIGSARIEGNNTTVAQFIETKLENRPFVNEQIEEIRNIERAMQWVDDIAIDYPLNRSFISQLHKMIVNNLTPGPDGEGDRTPGAYRITPVEIRGAVHIPPEPIHIPQLMDELFEFVERDTAPQYDLLRIAIAHHRFMWIHPFSNGNGRTGRLLTYAMLVKTGFRVHVGQILNPTAVFCIDRARYNQRLAYADTGTPEAMEAWCKYVLEGLLAEIQKIERLAHSDYVCSRLLLPALAYSYRMKFIDDDEYSILKVAARQTIIQASDVKPIFKGQHQVTISRKIRALRDKNMLLSETENSNKYHLSFINNFLIRGMIHALEHEGYIPLKD